MTEILKRCSRSIRSRDLIWSMSGKSILFGKYKLLQPLGGGGLNVTYRAIDKSAKKPHKKYVAVQVQKRGDYESSSQSEQIANEVKALKKVRVTCHRNIVEFRGYHPTDSYDYIVTKYYAGTTLAEQIGNGIEEERAKDIILKLLDGLIHLKSLDVFHCNVKPENVIIHDDEVRIIDFSLACNKPTRNDMVGTEEYMAPEVFLSPLWDCQTGDVWSLAITFIQMLTGKTPWRAARLQQDATYEHYLATRLNDMFCLRALVPSLTGAFVNHTVNFILDPIPKTRPDFSYMKYMVERNWKS